MQPKKKKLNKTSVHLKHDCDSSYRVSKMFIFVTVIYNDIKTFKEFLANNYEQSTVSIIYIEIIETI